MRCSVDERWIKLKNAVKTSAETIIGYKKTKASKKPWVNEQIILKMEERRKWKNVNTAEGWKRHNRLNNELRRETDRAREKW